MTVQTYNTIELRYASSELAKHNFVKEEEVLKRDEEISSLQESIEILRAERSYWHTMYNQEAASVEN